MRFLSLLCLFFIVKAVMGGTTTAKPDRCSLPLDRGLCRALIPLFYYDNIAKKCQKFYGCYGVGNNFATLKECEKACERKNLE